MESIFFSLFRAGQIQQKNLCKLEFDEKGILYRASAHWSPVFVKILVVFDRSHTDPVAQLSKNVPCEERNP